MSRPFMRRHMAYGLLAAVVLLALAALAVVVANRQGEQVLPDSTVAFDATPTLIERGRYLALAGNCAGCHTARGGAAYAGGVGIDTPFGIVYSTNLTPDDAHGLGRWSAANFWRALHNGRSKDGRRLYPAFPYPSFTKVTREDSDALYAYLSSIPAVATPNPAHQLRFPYSTQAALVVWRALSFTPGTFTADAAKTAEWNRGAYLVEGLGHCIACHGSRNVLGATEDKRGLSGGSIPIENWYAPSLTSPREASVADWELRDVVALLQTGVSPHASVMGPMADVVYDSTQYLSDADLTAMATYLQQMPASLSPTATAAPNRSASNTPRDSGVMVRGARLYDQNCAYCHGDNGQGAPGAYPPLAGSRAVAMASPVNLIQAVRQGGFLPATAGNPRPHGMPPFGHVLDDSEIAAVLTFVRGSWGNNAAAITPQQVLLR